MIAAGLARVVSARSIPTRWPPAAPTPPRGRDRGRVRRLLRGAEAERGVAHVGGAAAAVRDVQGGGNNRRSRDGAGVALGDRRGFAPRWSTSCGRRRTGSPSAWERYGRMRPASTPGMSRSAATAAPRVRPRSAPGGLGVELRRARSRGAGGARRGGNAVAAPRGGPDAGDGVPAEDLVDKVLLFVAPTSRAPARVSSVISSARWPSRG